MGLKFGSRNVPSSDRLFFLPTFRSRTYKRDRGSSYRYEERDKYNQEERPPKRQDKIEHSRISHAGSEENKKVSPKKESDSFWDTKWEAMELQKKADAQDRKGKHYLEDELKRKRAKEDSTPSLSPERSPSPECDELKRINKMKEIQVTQNKFKRSRDNLN